MGGTVGVMRSGVPVYHSLPRRIHAGSTRDHSKLIGWALDGFGIYGLRGRAERR